MSRARRTETLNAEFVDGYAQGWCFGVHEAFRAPLDISLDTRMDRAANQELAERLGRKPTAAERITRTVYTQGNPPAYAFSRGQLMHEPAIVHTLPWQEALPRLCRSVMVLDAQPDAGALPEALEEASQTGEALDDEATATTQAASTALGQKAASPTSGTDAAHASEAADGETPSAPGNGTDTASSASAGWVDIELYHYDQGRIRRRERHRLSQAGFVQLLRDGVLPESISQ